jgi:hypothetical protein
MEHTTFLQDLIGLLISVVIPLVLVMVLVIKNPQTTLSLIKTVFKLLVSAGKFIVPLIVSFIVWVEKTFTNDEYLVKSSSDYGFSSDSLSAQQRHNMDSNGMSRSEVIRNPHW